MDGEKHRGPERLGRQLRERAPLVLGLVGVAVVMVAVVRVGGSGSASGGAVGVPSASVAAVPGTASAAAPRYDDVDDGRLPSGVPLRPMDHDIFAAVNNFTLTREQMTDVFPDKPYRVQFGGSLADRRVSAVLIDLKRSGVPDERWELRKGEVFRTVPKDPAANGQPVKYTLAHGRWQVH